MTFTIPFGLREVELYVICKGTLSGERMSGTFTTLEPEYVEVDEKLEKVWVEGKASGKWFAERQMRYPSEEEELQEQKERKEAQEEEVNPVVTEVLDVYTGRNAGSILGGDDLQITGSGFVVPQGWKAEAQFYLGGEEVGQSEATAVTATQINAYAPDLASLASKVGAGNSGLALDVRVHIFGDNEEGEERSFTSPVSGADIYDALTPTVTSVEDERTTTHSGPIQGGDKLRVRGSGFLLPDDGSAHVDFYLGGASIQAVSATVINENEIEVEAPDLTKYESEIPAGKEGLETAVRVEISSEEGSPGASAVLSPESPGDLYEALNSEQPVVASVTDESNGSDHGPIFGGQTLQIDGSGFNVPEGGKAKVSFELEGEVLGEVIEVTPNSPTEIEVKAPDLVKYDSRVAPGSEILAFGTADLGDVRPGGRLHARRSRARSLRGRRKRSEKARVECAERRRPVRRGRPLRLVHCQRTDGG